MLGFDDVRALAHAAEDVLASVRDGRSLPPGVRGTAAPCDRRIAGARSTPTGPLNPWPAS